ILRCESLDSTGGWLSASRFKRCAYSMNSGRLILGDIAIPRIAPIFFLMAEPAKNHIPSAQAETSVKAQRSQTK
ncbi:hypothetical protein, partial [Pseudomonas fluorescens]|uniref:hypothetical protein n=1 Tax=Pseudomonas fluorescens TaxID=294 RepID=UPI001F3E5C0C